MARKRGRPPGYILDGDEIRRLRKFVHHLTAAQLGARVGLTEDLIWKAEKSLPVMDINAAKIAKALGVELEDIARPRAAALDELKPPPLYTTGAQRGLPAHSNKTTEGTTRSDNRPARRTRHHRPRPRRNQRRSGTNGPGRGGTPHRAPRRNHPPAPRPPRPGRRRRVMTGYTPAELAIRAALGLPYATGMDDEATWHHHHDDTPEVTA